MATQLIALSEEDFGLLQGLIDDRKQTAVSTPIRSSTESSWSDREDHQAPETYVAKPQDHYGIDGLSVGDGYPDYDDEEYPYFEDLEDIPGTAICDIYKILGDQLVPIGMVARVYNVSTIALNQDYIPITRDKFGKWLATAASPNGNETMDFVILEWFPNADPDMPVCDCVLVEVTGVSCTASVKVGDQVLVCDPQLCWFNLPIEILVGTSGWASFMNRGGLITNLECPVLLVMYGVGSCIWVVRGLCCTESAGYLPEAD